MKLDFSATALAKIKKYLFCLQQQLIFVNDCLIAMESIIEANKEPQKPAVTRGFVTTAFLAMQDDVIITLSKMFDNTSRADTICANSLIKALKGNKQYLTDEWQQKNYADYCGRFNIDDYIRETQPIHVFYTITDAVSEYEKKLEEIQSVINNINLQRDTYYAHNDKKYADGLEIKRLEEEFPLNKSGILQSLGVLNNFLTRIAMATGNDVYAEHSFYADNFFELLNDIDDETPQLMSGEIEV